MANTIVSYQQIRFDINEEDLTHCYVLIKNESNDGFPVGGWHHKAFPATVSAADILGAWAHGQEQPLMWERKAPPADGEAASVADPSKSTPCPHAGPFNYCPTCPVTPCPIGLGARNER